MPFVQGVKLSAKVQGLIYRLEQGAVDESWKGSRHPDDHRNIERRYARARLKLAEYISELESK